MRDKQRDREDGDEVDDQRSSDSDHGDNLVDDLTTLAGEKHEDRVKQADERPWRDVFEEHPLVPFGARHPLDHETRDDGGSKRNPEEDSNANCDGGVGHSNRRLGVADDVDEEDRHGGIQYDLQD